MAQPRTEPGYAFDNAWHQARERLDLIERHLDPYTVRRLEEADGYPAFMDAPPALAATWRAFLAVARMAGSNPEWARHLPSLVSALGLDGVRAEGDVEMFTGGSLRALFWKLSFTQVRPRMIAGGMSEAALDEGMAGFDDRTLWITGPATVAVWGQRPTSG